MLSSANVVEMSRNLLLVVSMVARSPKNHRAGLAVSQDVKGGHRSM